MSSLAENPARVFVIAVLLLALLMGAQTLGAATAPPGGVAATGRIIGQTSYAYLGGLRTFAAAVLWNRLDTLFHEYYGSTFNRDFVVFMPTIRAVIALDPHFVQAYYVASFYLAQSGRVDDGLALAYEGVQVNPTSGIMRSNYIQVLGIKDQKKTLPQQVAQARIALQPGTTYANIDEEFEALGVYRTVFLAAHETTTAQMLLEKQKVLETQGAGAGVERSTPSTASTPATATAPATPGPSK